ncbi:MAG TPA: hypothetical protein VF912_21215 [Anaeromyxobacter sp.]
MIHAGLVLLGIVLSAGGAGASEHMLAGARLFRDGRFAEALVEFRVARKLGAPEADGYAGVALVKLDRPEEAIEAFGSLDAPGPDPLLDYYRALAAHDARLYLAADRLLAGAAGRGGPRLAELAAKLRARIAPVIAQEPTQVSIDWYASRCAALRSERRTTLAHAFCTEAAALSERRPHLPRRGDGGTSARVAGPGGQP